MATLSLIARTAALACCALIAWQAALLWDGTGRAGFTRFHDPQRDGGSGVAADLFAGTGLEDETGELEQTPNSTALGALPSAYPWQLTDRHFVSMATLVVPAALAGGLILAEPALRRRGRNKR